MNEQTRYAMAIYQIGVIIRDTMEYLIPAGQNGYNKDVYLSRQQMLQHLLEENAPFQVFCNNNKTPAKEGETSIGERISSQVHEFFDDVYGEDSRIVKLEHDEVVVESSLVLQMLDYIIGLHETISDICIGFRNQFEKDKVLEEDFDELLKVDDPFFRSVAFRCVATNFVKKFIEYNEAVRAYISSERQTKGIDPSKDPNFNPKNDPSCAFISNEMNRIMGFFTFLRGHNKSTDVIFKSLIEKMEDQFHFFDGSKQVPQGKTMKDCMESFELIFVPVIDSYRDAWLTKFNVVFKALNEYERALMEKFEAEKKEAEKKEENK